MAILGTRLAQKEERRRARDLANVVGWRHWGMFRGAQAIATTWWQAGLLVGEHLCGSWSRFLPSEFEARDEPTLFLLACHDFVAIFVSFRPMCMHWALDSVNMGGSRLCATAPPLNADLAAHPREPVASRHPPLPPPYSAALTPPHRSRRSRLFFCQTCTAHTDKCTLASDAEGGLWCALRL